MPDEQPYFMVKVTRCGECPHLFDYDDHCRFVGQSYQHGQIVKENRTGITPTCPMWPQRVQEKKDE